MGWANGAFVLIICMRITCMVVSDNLFTDESALLAFKDGIVSDPNNILTRNWSRGTDVCHWHGITCGKRHLRVTSLKLKSKGLSGTIAKEVGNLSFLVDFDIGNNSFQGYIPQEIGRLHRLKNLSLQYNELTGPIPSSLGSLDGLQLLDLSNNRLVGTIPFSIFNISSLMIIDFNTNQLYGTLPPNLCQNLPRVRGLSASANNLRGNPPFLGKCRQAIYISLSRNEFTGGFPKEIGSLSALQEIYLGWNNWTGSLPEEIGNASALRLINLHQSDLIGILPRSLVNLSNLEMIDLGDNNFHGRIPFEYGHFPNLQELYLGFNNFRGEIPSPVYNLSELEVLALPGNFLSGRLPSDMAIRLPNLQRIFLGINQFVGPIPTSISNASNLVDISLGSNLFSGHIPETLGSLPHLKTVILQNNTFTLDPTKLQLGFLLTLINNPSVRTVQIGYNPLNGVLPKSLTSDNISFVEKLHLSGSGLKGMIPADIGNFSNLSWLSLAKNNLRGEIPNEIGRLRTLQRIRLFDNKIGGEIPNGMCNLKMLYELRLSKNMLSGELPRCLGNISSLREIYLDSNALTSPLPSPFWSNKDLLIVDLSSNFLNGSVSQQIGGSKGLRELYLAQNNFSGQIPISLGGLKDLINLSLSTNMLSGPLPEGLRELTSLAYLDMSHNHISGVIPKFMEKLPLVFLNLSFNELQGEIPNEGPFQRFSADSFIGNAALCGASRFNVSACKIKEQKSTRQVNVLKYIIPFGALSLLIIGLVVRMLKFKNKDKNPNVEAGLELIKRFSYMEILQETGNLDEANLVGRGSYCVVYRGTFPNGMVAAIKIFNLETQGALKSFDVECEVMRNIRHRNLVKVISACSNQDFKAIIFEYMPNGSLESCLHSSDNCLDIIQRLQVMIDVASALEYLHHGCASPMAHCDLKPNNILFNENMVAHLADFGIAKLIAGDKSMVLTKTLGTMGYMAPEYGSEGIISTMVDVYSFGILLMETFTGKRPTSEDFTDEFTLKRWVSDSLQDAIMEVIDPKLLYQSVNKKLILQELTLSLSWN